MPGKGCRSSRKHTPIRSKAQWRKFGALVKKGEMSESMAKKHWEEASYKSLPERIKKKSRRRKR